MRRQLSIKTKFGWISVFEEKDRIVKVKFGKHKNIYTSKNLKKFKSSLNAFLNRKSKSIKSSFIIKGTAIQKKSVGRIKKHQIWKN